MEKLNFVKNGGVIKLPPGFRFHPTNEELVVQYLKCKVLSNPLTASVIPEVDVCKSYPWDLPSDVEQERYFFSTREVKHPNGNRSNRATSSGYWNSLIYEAKVTALFTLGTIDEVMDVIDREMVENSCVPTVRLYNTLIRGLYNKGNPIWL